MKDHDILQEYHGARLFEQMQSDLKTRRNDAWDRWEEIRKRLCVPRPEIQRTGGR